MCLRRNWQVGYEGGEWGEGFVCLSLVPVGPRAPGRQRTWREGVLPVCLWCQQPPGMQAELSISKWGVPWTGKQAELWAGKCRVWGTKEKALCFHLFVSFNILMCAVKRLTWMIETDSFRTHAFDIT